MFNNLDSSKDFNISFNLNRTNLHHPINEFIPEGAITNTVSSYSLKNLFTVIKIKPHSPWSFENGEGGIDLSAEDIKVEMIAYASMTNYMDMATSYYSRISGGDQRFGAVSSSGNFNI
jgi:hypothetical protein